MAAAVAGAARRLCSPGVFGAAWRGLYGRVLVAFSPGILPASVGGIFRGSQMQAKHQERILQEHGHTAQKPHNTPVISAVKAVHSRLQM